MEFKQFVKILAIIFITVLFIYSGLNKIYDFNNTTLGFHQKVNSGIMGNIFTLNLSKIIIMIAISILIIAPFLMIIGITKKNKLLLQIGSALLIIFTILATIIYHPITNPNEINNFLKNLSIIGGLMIVAVNE